MFGTRTQTTMEWSQKKMQPWSHFTYENLMNLSLEKHSYNVLYQCFFQTVCCYWFPIWIQKKMWKYVKIWKLFHSCRFKITVLSRKTALHMHIKQATWSCFHTMCMIHIIWIYTKSPPLNIVLFLRRPGCVHSTNKWKFSCASLNKQRWACNYSWLISSWPCFFFF